MHRCKLERCTACLGMLHAWVWPTVGLGVDAMLTCCARSARLPVGEVRASPPTPIACFVRHPDRVVHPPILPNSCSCKRRRPISATPSHSQAWCAPPPCRRPAPWPSALLPSVPALACRRARALLGPSGALCRPATPLPPASGTPTPPCPREQRRERGGDGGELLGWVPVALPPAAAPEQPSALPPMAVPHAATAPTPW